MCRVISSCAVPGSGVIRTTSFCLLESKSQIEEMVCNVLDWLVCLWKSCFPASPVLFLRTDPFWKGQSLPS